jgi:hypothetical protein
MQTAVQYLQGKLSMLDLSLSLPLLLAVFCLCFVSFLLCEHHFTALASERSDLSPDSHERQ